MDASVRSRLSRSDRMEQTLRVAHGLFAERGYADVTMDEIAAEVGVTKPLLYNYFGNKERLYIACMEEAGDSLIRTIGESIAECAAREVFEETGLVVREATPFVQYTGAKHIHTDMYGNTYQLHVTGFRVDSWSGELLRETDETTDAGFFPPDALPEPLSHSVPAALADLAAFERTGRFVLG